MMGKKVINWEERTWQAFLAIMARDRQSVPYEMLKSVKRYIECYKKYLEEEE